VLSHADFHALEKQLEQKETWEQVVGVTCFGGNLAAESRVRVMSG
jgi:hypothetical protein